MFKAISRRNQLSAIYLLILLFAIVFFELASFTLIIPALSILLESNILENNNIFIFLQNSLEVDLIQFLTLEKVLFSITILITIKVILLLYFEYKIGKVLWQTQMDINTKIYKHFTILSFKEIVDIGYNRMRRLIGTDATLFVTQGLFNYILLIKNILLIFFLFLFLFQIDQKITVSIFLFLSIFIFIFSKLLRGKAILLSKKDRELTQYKHKNINETITGIREVKLFNNEDIVTRLFLENEKKLSKNAILKLIYNKLPRTFLEFFIVLGISIITYVFVSKGNSFVDILPEISIFMLVILRSIPIATDTNNRLLSIKYVKIQIDEIISYLNKIKLSQNSIVINHKIKYDLKENNKLEFKNVSFEYNNSKKIFENLNVEFIDNNIIGIQGDNGSGKSTLVDLIAGFLKPQKGIIEFNNVNIFENLKAWRDNLGYVSQSQFLTNDTIKNNIIFSNDNFIDHERFEEAIELSGVKLILPNMSNGLDTYVGDMGMKLSGGQKQRITIARVFYRNPKIIILDEPTSAQDNKIEKSFMEVLKKIKKDKIIIIISHSKNIHSICDLNFKVENEKLIKF